MLWCTMFVAILVSEKNLRFLGVWVTNLSGTSRRPWSRCSVAGIVVLKVDGSWSKRRWDKCWARRGRWWKRWRFRCFVVCSWEIHGNTRKQLMFQMFEMYFLCLWHLLKTEQVQRPEARTKSGQPNSEVPNRWGNSSELAKVAGLKWHQDAGCWHLLVCIAHLNSQNCYKNEA